jgi:hypothetical protein
VDDHGSRHDRERMELIDIGTLDQAIEEFATEEGLLLDRAIAAGAHEPVCLDDEFPREASLVGILPSEEPAQEFPSELAPAPVRSAARQRRGPALAALTALAVVALTGALGLEAVRRSRPQDERPPTTRGADIVLTSEASTRQSSAPVERLAPAVDAQAPPIAHPTQARDEQRPSTLFLPPSRVVEPSRPTSGPAAIGILAPAARDVAAANTSSPVGTPARTAADVPVPVPAGTSGAPTDEGRPAVERPVSADIVAAERAPAVPVVTPISAIQRALGQYQSAYSQLDVAAVRRLWPTVDGKALAKAFDQVRQENLTFDSCDVGVYGRTAVASCAGTTQYVPKVGSKSTRVERQQWRISLSQATDAWVIDKVEVSRD